MDENHYKPPSTPLLEDAYAPEAEVKRFRFRLIPAMLCLSVSICFLTLLFVLMAVWVEAGRGGSRIANDPDKTEGLAMIVASAFIMIMFGDAARCWYLRFWKRAVAVTLGPLLSFSVFIAFVVKDR